MSALVVEGVTVGPIAYQHLDQVIGNWYLPHDAQAERYSNGLPVAHNQKQRYNFIGREAHEHSARRWITVPDILPRDRYQQNGGLPEQARLQYSGGVVSSSAVGVAASDNDDHSPNQAFQAPLCVQCNLLVILPWD